MIQFSSRTVLNAMRIMVTFYVISLSHSSAFAVEGEWPPIFEPARTQALTEQKDHRIDPTVSEITLTSEPVGDVTNNANQTSPATPLTPGQTFYLEFPKLGKTWKGESARAGVYLPSDYSPDKTFPLLVWFGGGAGSDTPKKPIEITDGKGFVCVAVPYRNEDGNQTGGWQTPWSYYKTIFDKLETVVSNIDPAQRVAGGASSGGAAVMFQIGNSEEAFQEYFHAFIPAMAGWPMGGLESIKGRPMLAIMGEKDKRLPNFRVLEKEAIAAGVDFQFLLLKDVAHKMPSTSYPEIREWLTKKVIERKAVPKTTASANEPIEMKILYIGKADERSKDYTTFLEKHFSSVTSVDSQSLTSEQANASDVMIIDAKTTSLPFGFDKACVMIGGPAAQTGQHYGSKIDWLCLCLSNEAYQVDTKHPIFHTHFDVTPTLVKKKCKYTTLQIEAWKVEEPQDKPGLVSSRRYFENAADSEIISGGVNMKGISGVPLVREANRFLWGFIAPPSEMTDEAKQVFVNAIVWMQQFDGAKQTVFRGLHERGSYNGVVSSPYVDKDNIGQWFSQELLESHKFDKESLGKQFEEDLGYVYIPLGHGQMEIDQDAKRLQTPNNQVTSLDKWIEILSSGEDAQTAIHLLKRYTDQDFPKPEDWKTWLEENRSKLRFEDARGYRFFVSQIGDRPQDAAKVKALDQTSSETPSSVAPVIFDRAIVGKHVIDGDTYAFAGSQVTLTVRAKILEPWHIYAPDLDNGVNIPTKIEVDLPSGMEFVGPWQYPDDPEGHLGDGTIFSRKIKLKKQVSANPIVTGTIKFQACTSIRCLPPQELKFVLPLTVVAFEH